MLWRQGSTLVITLRPMPSQAALNSLWKWVTF